MTVMTGALYKVVWGGKLNQTDEWACSIHMASDVPNPGTDITESLQPPIHDWFSRADTLIQAGANLEFVKCNEVNRADGKYSLQVTHQSFWNPIISGPGDSARRVPGQLTQVISLHTAISRGRGAHGRFFPPTAYSIGLSNKLDDTGRVEAGIAKLMADSAQELLSELAAAATPRIPVVWSQAGQVAQSVIRVSCGRVIDTQRRRRSSLDEDRQFATAEV
jgi:hypothetical protein